MPASPAVVLTREREDNRALARALEAAGVRVVEIPCVSTRYRDPDPDEVQLLPPADLVDAITFTSRRGVRGWGLWAGSAGPGSWPARIDPGRTLICAVGRGTERELEAAGMPARLIADPPSGRVLASLVASQVATAGRVASVGGDLRAGDLEEGLGAAGLEVFRLTVYENPRPEVPVLEPFDVAAVLVASPSAGTRLVEAMPWMRTCRFVAVGPTTRRALEALGIESVEEPGTDPDSWERCLAAAARDAVRPGHEER